MVTGGGAATWRWAAVVVAVALATTLSGLGNQFAFDDVPVIVESPALHSLSTALPRAFAPYLHSQMLRPIPMLGFSLQWVLGDGSPLVFRIVSVVLYAIVCLLVLALCRARGAHPGPCLLGALVFAVHPVHAEVTANGVGQSELWVALLVLAAAAWYLRVRTGGVWRTRDSMLLATLVLLAEHAKEVGYVLPGLLLALEVLVVQDRRPWAKRLAALREPALAVVGATVVSLWIRSSLLGEMGGGLPHQSLEGMSFGARAIAVLGFVPEWFRLLLWPVRLQIEYGPPALDAVAEFGTSHFLGALLVVGSVTAFALAWRRRPLIALGLAWIGIALAPVANLLFPTPILLAERSFFLPSVGLALIVAGATEALLPWFEQRRGLFRIATVSIGLILATAAWRTAARQPVWRDTLTILRSTVADAPGSYRAFFLLGRALVGAGDPTGGRRRFGKPSHCGHGTPSHSRIWASCCARRGIAVPGSQSCNRVCRPTPPHRWPGVASWSACCWNSGGMRRNARCDGVWRRE